MDALDRNPAPAAEVRPKRWPRFLFIVAVVVTLIALFYAVENWRGRVAWERCKKELTARGEQLDWQVFKPKPVPDDQNFMKAPFMDAWFRKSATRTEAVRRLQDKFRSGDAYAKERRGTAFPVLEIVVLSGSEDSRALKSVLLADFEVEDASAFAKGVTRAAESGILGDPRSQSYILLAGAPNRKVLRVSVRLPANTPPAHLVAKLKRFYFNVENTSQTNVLRLVCTNALSAEDVMGWFETLDPEFQALATACERPQAWIPGDYDKPFAGPLPDFVNFRMFAQALAARAKASLLLGRPDSALRDVRMIMRLSGVLEQTSPTLVPAMIQVAIAGLIADIVADGLLIGAWQEPQLAALQEELGKVNLLVPLARAFRGGERAGILYALEQSKAHQLAASVRGSDSSVGTLLRDLWSDPLSRYLLLAPRGWIAQNQVRIAWALQTLIGRLDANGKRFVNDTLPNPYRLDQVANRPATPYNYFARFVIPNFARVRETLARNQVLLDMAAIACALERCRAATGSYPETLDALVPRFLSLLTHDIYTGEPLKYRRTPDGKYLLYSVGANLRDDSGTAATTTTTSATPRADDWVWEALPTKR